MILEPLVNSSSRILIIGYIEWGITQLFAQKVNHVTTVVNPQFVDKLLMKTAYTYGLLSGKIHYIPLVNRVDGLVKEITQGSIASYDYIVSFESYQPHEIRKLLRMMCPFGAVISYGRRQKEFNKFTLRSDNNSESLKTEVLATEQELARLNLITGSDSNQIDSKSMKSETGWSVVSRKSRSRNINSPWKNSRDVQT